MQGILALTAAAAVMSPAEAIVSRYQGTWKAHRVEQQSVLGPQSDRTLMISNECSMQGADAVCLQSVDGRPAGSVHYVYAGSGSFKLRNTDPAGRDHDGGTSWSDANA